MSKHRPDLRPDPVRSFFCACSATFEVALIGPKLVKGKIVLPKYRHKDDCDSAPRQVRLDIAESINSGPTFWIALPLERLASATAYLLPMSNV